MKTILLSVLLFVCNLQAAVIYGPILTGGSDSDIFTNISQVVASLDGLATNLNIKSASGASLALTVNTNSLVVTNGRVGIGTNAPGASLDVNGGVSFNGASRGQSGSSFAITQFGAAPGGNRSIVMFDSGTANIATSGKFAFAASGSDAGASSDTFIYRHGAGTNGIGANNSVPSGSVLASNYIAHGVISLKGMMATNIPPAGHAGLFAATNSGTVELMAIDSAGNVTQISPHAMDSPGLAADNSPLPMIIRHRNDYAGVEEWIHLSKLARAVEQLTGERFIYTNAVAKRGWQADQDAEQSSWNAARQAEIEASNSGDTNVTIRPPRNVKQQTPVWLKSRGQR